MAKKSHNAINIISSVSLVGVAVGTMALIVVLSVFNGFDDLVRSLFNSFNPDLKVIPATGKVFLPDTVYMDRLSEIDGVADFSSVLEDKALLKYDYRQTVAIVKGVDDHYLSVTGMDTMLTDGNFRLEKGDIDYTVVGQGIAIFLGIGLNMATPINVYVPKRLSTVSFNPDRAINRKYLFPAGVFSIQQEFDARYIIVPIDFASQLLGYSGEVSALEIKVKPSARVKEVQKAVSDLLGPGLIVKNRYQQNELFYKTMQTEKWAIFLILAFILIIASFNVIGSLTMLIIEKKKDIGTLRNLGASIPLIRKIFLLEGWLISASGAVSGLVLGLLICWVQLQFELVQLQGSGTFVIDAYPVSIKITDIFAVFITVLMIGFFASWYPIRFITRRLLVRVRQ